MDYETAKSIRNGMYAAVEAAGARLQQFPRNEIGLTPDHIKFSAEYRAVKAEYDSAHRLLREFNKRFLKTYRLEYRAERRTNRG